MSPVFGHGRLRLYLLKLLEESPRHGYEVIRLLQDRFLGVYSPSPGTIYPRLARLEEEGLVTHEVKDGKKVFTLTDKGRAELNDRLDELADLEQEIANSVRDIAREVKEDVRETVRSLRDELTQMTREMRGGDAGRQVWQQKWREERQRQREEWRRQRDEWRRHRPRLKEERDQWVREWRRIWDETWGPSGRRSEHDAELGRMLADFVEGVRREAAGAELNENTLAYCREALDDVSARIREAFRS
ncbi:PadR family transcriptional regulator [Thermopolyspora sp. NPDC052614]|uniref:PadR family transcriptional regulator n=1 Tax=Thermopolyspora sp. NPDC052614 TaxID=3155682 RepID=UPI00341D59DB